MARFGIIGAGSWGTALAGILASNGHVVKLWARDSSVLEEISDKRVNSKYLPHFRVPSEVLVQSDLPKMARGQDGLIMAVPSHAVRHVLDCIPSVDPRAVFVSVAKGIENETLLRVSQILAERFDENQIAVLSGPSHAEEVSRQIPTLVVCASKSHETATWVQNAFMASTFRVYTHHDVVGVELGGALKNVAAFASGVVDGVGGGDNTKAALITRALVEITRLGVRLGAEPRTFSGLSGMGDLIVTCMSKHSRNRHLGEEIARGKTLDEALAAMVMVAESVKTTRSAYDLAGQHGVEVPIIEESYKVLFENKNPRKAVFELMTRAAKVEDWG